MTMAGQSQSQRTEDGWRFRLRFLVRQEEDLFVAYCLELDLVAAAKTEDEAVRDLMDVTVEQIRYCIANDNMDRLFRRAPEEIWNEYYACEKGSTSESLIIEGPPEGKLKTGAFPFSFTASACRSQSLRHAV